MKHIEGAVLPKLASEAALDLAARGLWDNARRDKNNMVDGKIMRLGDSLANLRGDLREIGAMALRPLNLLNDHKPLLIIAFDDCERRAEACAQ